MEIDEHKVYYYKTDEDGVYETCYGPDFECRLGEPEDRSFGRDINPLLHRMNEQLEIIRELRSRLNGTKCENCNKDKEPLIWERGDKKFICKECDEKRILINCQYGL